MRLKFTLKHGERIAECQGCPGYFITDHGRVFSTKQGSVKLKKQHTNEYGYKKVQFNLPQIKQKKIHRLVAIEFVPKPEGKDYVHHIDNNKLNNHYTNLKWVTMLENTQLAIEDGLIRKVLSDADVRQIRDLKGYVSARDLADIYGVSADYVRRLWRRMWRCNC